MRYAWEIVGVTVGLAVGLVWLFFPQQPVDMQAGAAQIASAVTQKLGAEQSAENGELFGYRIWDRYPVSTGTKLSHIPPPNPWAGKAYFVLAERPVTPSEFGPVYLLVTQKTYTVLAITSSKDLESRERQSEFAERYIKVISAKYGRPAQGRSEEGAFFSFGSDAASGYQLFIELNSYSPTSPVSGSYAAHIGLASRNLQAMFDQAMKESYEIQSRDAAKSGSTKGL